jgi:hypothetical protein
MKPSWCAICADVTDDLVQRQLSPREPQIWICTDCDGEPAVTTDGPMRGYEVPEHQRGSVTRQAQAAVMRLGIPAMATRSRYAGREASTGFVLVRVSRKRGVIPIDRDAARLTLRGQPWYSELRHIGSDVRFHIFERPDVAAIRQHRRDPMEALRADIARRGAR